MLLHSLLEGLWGELRDQQQLLALSDGAQAALIARHWEAAVQGHRAAGVEWLAPGVLELERLRTERLMHRVLQMERERAGFVVGRREHELAWRSGCGCADHAYRPHR